MKIITLDAPSIDLAASVEIIASAPKLISLDFDIATALIITSIDLQLALDILVHVS
jgi:hypothetical protein